jgi:hypothetical protein
VGHLKVRGHLSEAMQIAAICHTEMAEQFVVLWAAVSFTAESVVERSHTEAFWVYVVDKLVTEFQKQQEWRSCLEKSDMRVCDLILGPPSGRV